MNSTLKSIALVTADTCGLFHLRRTLTRSQFRVVTYHGVDPKTDPVVNVDRLQTDPVRFTRQVEQLARVFRVVDLGETVRHFVATHTWPDRGLAITFDDGYRNNLEIAAPILKHLGIPATFFVTAGFVEGRGTPWWYDLREHLSQTVSRPIDAKDEAITVEARLRPMNEVAREAELVRLGVRRGGDPFYPLMNVDECRSLVGMGFDVQCHGDTHVSFSGETPDRVSSEVSKSADFIRRLGVTPWGMAYPYGHEPKDIEAVRKIMEAHGLVAAFTTREGANDRDADCWSLRRWDMHGGYSPLAAVARVS